MLYQLYIFKPETSVNHYHKLDFGRLLDGVLGDMPELLPTQFDYLSKEFEPYFSHIDNTYGTNVGKQVYCEGKSAIFDLKLKQKICGFSSFGVTSSIINKVISLARKNGHFVLDYNRQPLQKFNTPTCYFEAEYVEQRTTGTEFKNLLKEKFIPSLRELGFKGSYPNFYIEKEKIHLINFQGQSCGGSVRVSHGVIEIDGNVDNKTKKKIIKNGLVAPTILLNCKDNKSKDLSERKFIVGEGAGILGGCGKKDFWFDYKYEDTNFIIDTIYSTILEAIATYDN